MKYFFVLLILVAVQTTFAQDKDVQIGSSLNSRLQSQGGFFDYSDPEAVNIKVSVWGFVKYPGKYVIPDYSTLSDLLSYAGGPTDDAHLDDMRLFRTKPDSTQELIKFNYNDLLWEDNLTKEIKNPKLQAGDMVMVAGAQRLYTRDYVTLTVSVLSALISLSILILNIAKEIGHRHNMNNSNDKSKEYESNTFKDYLNLIRNNMLPVAIITFACLATAIFYAINSKNVYTAVTMLKNFSTARKYS